MDINQYVDSLEARPGALLVDARSPEEYAEEHIPGSVNCYSSACGVFPCHKNLLHSFAGLT